MSLPTTTELYPMRVVTRTTGLAADTIRAWERRYGAVQPHRTEGNARRYSGAHIHKLGLLRDLCAQGHSIGSIAQLEPEELEVLAREGVPQSPRSTLPADGLAEPLSAYLQAVSRFDTLDATERIQRAAALLDNRTLIFELVLPIIRHVGQLWAAGASSVAEEHLVSAELRALLSSRTQRLKARVGAPRLVLAAPAGHGHEFGILSARLLAAERGIDVVYLGTDVPASDLTHAVLTAAPAAITLGIARILNSREVAALSATIAALSEHTRVWLGCPADTAIPDGAHRIFHTLEEFDVACAALSS